MDNPLVCIRSIAMKSGEFEIVWCDALKFLPLQGDNQCFKKQINQVSTSPVKIGKNPRANWESQKAKLKLNFPKLTDSDLDYDETEKDKMFNKLEFKLAMTAAELKVIIETL